MNSTDLAFTPALEQAQLIRDKVISPLELTQLYLDRIQRYDAALHSFFTVMAEQAIAEAKAKTEQLAAPNSQPDPLPMFFGAPIAIKDFAPVAGAPCTYGIHLLKQRIATEDAGLVTRIRQAGFTHSGQNGHLANRHFSLHRSAGLSSHPQSLEIDPYAGARKPRLLLWPLSWSKSSPGAITVQFLLLGNESNAESPVVIAGVSGRGPISGDRQS